ncbi:hypothetical protein [Mycoplasma procyoni]|uniref:hypothetical protein n=1 Tax=Mycoplasma procyoni TaxID=568784 RepID=UPI00197B27B4|nr:hypothetical protein [Mycoplasma procyoni]MBN3535138.1 hypothetical protein [Mycoplasma procyoni]
MKVNNDQFYTKREIAKICFKKIKNKAKYSTIIEPSAGEGAFSNLNKRILAFDLEPRTNKIQKQDFFELDFGQNWGNKILFVGNPPFGQRSTIAKQFIKHAIKLHATTIAFILPDTFSKHTNQKYSLFPKEWKLIEEFKLPDDSFYIYENNQPKTYHVPCSFYVWTKDQKDASKDLRKSQKIQEIRAFSFLKRGDQSADFVINGNSARIKEVSSVTNSKSEHYIKVSKDFDKEDIINKLSKLEFKPKSSVNGGNYWINQTEIIELWKETYEKEEFQKFSDSSTKIQEKCLS